MKTKTLVPATLSAPPPPTQQNAPRGLLRLSQIVGDRYACPPIQPLVPVSRTTIWSWVKAGKFPRPLKIGPRTTAWRAEEIDAWMSQGCSN